VTPSAWRPAAAAAGALLFVVLATANGGGYRYGVSDQAFHVPAVLRALDASAFPRDAPLIDSQARLTVFDEAMALLVRATGASLETTFLAGYLLSVALVWVAVLAIGRRLYRSVWATIALAALVTLRHRIPRTTVNSLEPYFYPRTLAFGIGLLAVAAILHRRLAWALLAAVVAAVVHPTTGLWFLVLAAVAAVVVEVRLRPLALPLAAAGSAAVGWALAAGPLTAATTAMDGEWLSALASNNSLFPTQWPLWAWAANLALPALLVWIHLARRAHGRATREDEAVVIGALALVALFLLTMPAVAGRWTLPTQLQVSRVFWLIDFMLAVYVIALIVERPTANARAWPRLVALALLAVAAGRGGYVMLVEFPERSLFESRLPVTPWTEAMAWLRRQPTDVHVFADPGHAWKYGSSVRVAARRDVFLEETKDTAVAMYSREIATRVLERAALIASAGGIVDDRLARRLRDEYGVDYIVTEGTLSLPVAHENARFRVYALSREP
jgi:hypothetical protein